MVPSAAVQSSAGSAGHVVTSCRLSAAHSKRGNTGFSYVNVLAQGLQFIVCKKLKDKKTRIREELRMYQSATHLDRLP